MNWRLVATVGVGVTAFLIAGAGVTELLAASIEFSALVGLPVGVLVGAASAAATWLRLWKNPGARPALLGVAAAGYAVVTVAAASYAISSVRGLVSVERAFVVAGLAGVVAFALARVLPDRLERSRPGDAVEPFKSTATRVLNSARSRGTGRLVR